MESNCRVDCIKTVSNPTKTLAKKLGLIETIYAATAECDEVGRNGMKKSPQVFDYLIVVDFESTCWEGNKLAWRQPEIIEFPGVLMNLSNGVIEDEFQQYVMPSENPKLSEFCIKLTGITQQQVDGGVPLATCLLLFNRWLSRLSEEKKFIFHKNRDDNVKAEKSCTFVTWSDWDFLSCLHNECRRKQISKPELFNTWIDLRATYRDFYKRSPKGLRGALQEVGLNFEGREHSGLCDARNTAHLAWRMACDGALLVITKTHLPNTSTRAAKKCLFEDSSNGCKDITPARKPLQAMNSQLQLRAKAEPLVREHTSTNKRKISVNGKLQNGSMLKTHACEKDGSSTPNARCGTFRKNRSSFKTPDTTRQPAPSSSYKKTPPLCNCGRRAVRRLVSLPGPNQGRRFFACSNRKSLGMKSSSGCGFFHWDS